MAFVMTLFQLNKAQEQWAEKVIAFTLKRFAWHTSLLVVYKSQTD